MLIYSRVEGINYMHLYYSFVLLARRHNCFDLHFNLPLSIDVYVFFCITFAMTNSSSKYSQSVSVVLLLIHALRVECKCNMVSGDAGWGKWSSLTFKDSGRNCSKCSSIWGSSDSCTRRKCRPSGRMAISSKSKRKQNSKQQ